MHMHLYLETKGLALRWMTWLAIRAKHIWYVLGDTRGRDRSSSINSLAQLYSLRNGIRSRPSRSIVFWTGLPCIIAQQTAKIAQHGELNRRPPASSASGHAALANGPSWRLQCTRDHIYYGQI